MPLFARWPQRLQHNACTVTHCGAHVRCLTRMLCKNFFSAGLVALGLLVASNVVSAQTTVRLAVSRGPVSLPIYVAEAMGYFQREGVQVQIKDCASGRDCAAQLHRGEADVGTAAELVVVLDNLKKPELAILASITASWKQLRVVAHRLGGLETQRGMEGLADKRIGTVKGTSAEYFLHAWLNYYRLDPARVEIVGLPPTALAGALDKRQIDAMAVWEPEVSRTLQLMGKEAVLLPAPRVYTQHFVLATPRAALQRQRPELVRLLRALALSEDLILSRPEKAAQILMERIKVDVQAQGWEAQNFRLQLSPTLVETMAQQTQWALSQGLATNGALPRDVRDYIDPAVLREARPAAVQLP